VTATDTVVHLVQLAGAACFVLGLHRMRSPGIARSGNLLSAGAMTVVLGAYAARRVAMTVMPQLVSLFNAVGGGAGAHERAAR
jgi:NAD(P) transhydrogenase subunit beta